MEPSFLERVFDMFSQVRLHQNRCEGGLGIGLSLVRTIVQMHGGSVQAHSEGPNMGSTFTVRLPVLQHHAQVQPRVRLPNNGGQALRIVIADDNLDSAQSLCDLLEAEGHEVRAASTGRGAVEQVEDFGPALVFMDIGMPDMDGMEATRRIRQLPAGKNVLIVALTGWGQPQDRERTRQAECGPACCEAYRTR